MWVIKNDKGEYFKGARLDFINNKIVLINEIGEAFKFKTQEGAKNTIKVCKLKGFHIEEIKD